MSCMHELKRRASYENVSRLAKKALALVQDDIVIYRRAVESDMYAFCCVCEWEEKKGTAIKILRQNRGDKHV